MPRQFRYLVLAAILTASALVTAGCLAVPVPVPGPSYGYGPPAPVLVVPPPVYGGYYRGGYHRGGYYGHRHGYWR